jgi:Lrp/AsnC family leucine-responsive transcriptional regulator
MDAIDRRIIRELQADARLTNQDLAERVHLSPSPCLRRVRNLEKAGVIRGYAAIVDEVKVGLPVTVFVRIRLERHSEEAVARFEEAIGRIDEVMECHVLTGDFDYLLRVIVADLQAYETFVRGRIHPIPGIGGIETSFAYGTVKRRQVFPETAVG